MVIFYEHGGSRDFAALYRRHNKRELGSYGLPGFKEEERPVLQAIKKPVARVHTGFSEFGSPSWTHIELYAWHPRERPGPCSSPSLKIKISELDSRCWMRGTHALSFNFIDRDSKRQGCVLRSFRVSLIFSIPSAAIQAPLQWIEWLQNACKTASFTSCRGLGTFPSPVILPIS